jgi:small subunit ribosomal protein S4
MAIDRTPVYKRCRYHGIDPNLLGYTHKPSVRSRLSRTKPSAYALQLREKQKVKFIYGVLENQFRRTFEAAAREPGITGENLMRRMELRLDNVAFRLGLGKTRAEARQLVGHGRVTVNGRRVDIPSIELKAGDVVGLHPGAVQAVRTRRLSLGRRTPVWLSFDEEAMAGTVVSAPSRKDLDFEIRESMIVELYSK